MKVISYGKRREKKIEEKDWKKEGVGLAWNLGLVGALFRRGQ